uniref:Uncharacterized protein n=1 Tax=Opuntia streptacantha TaxID=393608 RepID=A0A7C9EB16_OPUST
MLGNIQITAYDSIILFTQRCRYPTVATGNCEIAIFALSPAISLIDILSDLSPKVFFPYQPVSQSISCYVQRTEKNKLQCLLHLPNSSLFFSYSSVLVWNRLISPYFSASSQYLAIALSPLLKLLVSHQKTPCFQIP